MADLKNGSTVGGRRIVTEGMPANLGSTRVYGYANVISPTQSPRAAGNETFDCLEQNIFYKSGGTATLDFANFNEGQVINIVFASTGSAYTLTWPSEVKWNILGVPTPTPDANVWDVYTFIKIGGMIFGTGSLAMS